MKLARNYALAMIAAVLILSGLASGQVLKQVPSDALVVFKVSNLEGTSKKIADFAASLGLAQMKPEFADPLAAFEKDSGISQGLNKAGDVAFVFLDPATAGGDADKSMLILLPVSDYKAFLGNWPDAKPDGDITEVHFKNAPDSSFVANWGEFAAISPTKEILAKKPEGLAVGGLAGKEMDGKDFVLFANMKALRPRLLPDIEKGRKLVQDQIDSMIENKADTTKNIDLRKIRPILKVAVNQLLNVSQEFVQDADAATVSANLSTEGIGTTVMAEFAEGSYLGKTVSQVKNTDGPLLAGLPDGKYIVFGGSTSDPKIASQLLSDFVDPISKELANLGDQGKPIQDMIDAGKAAVGAATGSTFGLVAPNGQLGKDPLIQFISIKTGDAKVLADSQRKILQAQQDAMKTFGVDAAGAKTTFTAGAKNLDGVTFDQYVTSFNMNPQTQQQMQAQQMVTFMYGADGMTMNMGLVNDKTLLTTSGIPDTLLSQTITAAKNGDDVLSKTSTVKQVSAQLPAERIAVVYFPMDQLVSSGLNYAKQFSMDMGVKIPDDLPPIGMTISTDGTAVRIDSYIPSQLVQALTSAGMTMYLNSHQNGAGGPNGM